MTSSELTHKRSNRPLTQFACRLTDAFLLGRLAPGHHTNHNTTVIYEQSPLHHHLSVHLWDETLLSLSVSAEDQRPLQLLISLGSVFDNQGCPARATVERLNGLLDCLGFHHVIPEGVRVFRNTPDGPRCLGLGNGRVMVGRQFATEVLLRPDPEAFIVEATGSMAVPLQLERCATA
jgi:hypothetical protein